jgi:hypothetical protein
MPQAERNWITLQNKLKEDLLTKLSYNRVENFTDHVFLLFGVGLPKHIRCLVSHEGQSRITVDDTYDIMDMDLRVKGDG